MPHTYSSSTSQRSISSGLSSSYSRNSEGKSQTSKPQTSKPLIHNSGGRSSDEKRRSDWDGGRWK
ncbi:uncharacterized protein CIMG_12084 [Coccidioides immitis RS]|uniref:Uncharacterized protein n=4 Tax=Coccidioides immitis TaxID=5501 RepID=A0A0D8JU75_COCIM|nr:uncharacterized protein CIMG_12084 [Coccidioides immitis RS]KJF60842.1 hypothetical protein CIMG_12084 [Coccidioides immitis RS]KMP06459.1 hypothetical protein CIRG_06139 [Coccidioides immitis RMSCC 2394]KMU80329.1 hypothetical protein CISG_02180 [Coccidioides immitis RMSCC 3703]KMU84034.1 hypothetical protein CIHG_01818 [Coccidioides immitis H538.4]